MGGQSTDVRKTLQANKDSSLGLKFDNLHPAFAGKGSGDNKISVRILYTKIVEIIALGVKLQRDHNINNVPDVPEVPACGNKRLRT